MRCDGKVPVAQRKHGPCTFDASPGDNLCVHCRARSQKLSAPDHHRKHAVRAMGQTGSGGQAIRIKALEAGHEQYGPVSPSYLKGGKPYEPGVLPLKPPGGRP